MKNNLRLLVLIIFIGGAIYFWSQANGWENIISNDWSKNPLLSNASGSFEYLRALVKIVILGFATILAMLYLQNNENKVKQESERLK